MTWQVGKLPYAALIDASGVLRAKGLVNTREHLESLFEAKERGVASIQDWPNAERTEVAIMSIERPTQRSWIDRLAERGARGLARHTSRRSFLARLGAALVGGAAFPLLPVARAAEEPRAAAARATPALARRDAAIRPLQLLAPLRHRRVPVLVLRRLAERVSAGHRDVAGHVDRHLPPSRRRQGLRHLVQRLLRAVALHALPLHPHRGREAGLLHVEEQRPPVVLRHEEPRGPLLGGDRARGGDRSRDAGPRSPRWRCAGGGARWTPAAMGGRPSSTTRSSAQGCHRADGTRHAGQRARARGLGGALPRRAGRPRLPGAACPASRRRRSTTRRSRRCSTGCSSASTAPTCRPASRRTPPTEVGRLRRSRCSTSTRRGRACSRHGDTDAGGAPLR